MGTAGPQRMQLSQAQGDGVHRLHIVGQSTNIQVAIYNACHYLTVSFRSPAVHRPMICSKGASVITIS